MDFFGQQQQARRRTALLIGLFIAAVMLIILLCNLLIVFVVADEQQLQQALFSDNTLTAVMASELGITVALSVILVISLVVMAKWLSLRGGGHKVAESLGGKRVPTNSQDPQLRQLLNVVEEMALAANMVVPPVYILQHENTINAFAAGNCQRDAVIGITKGTLELLNRQQLQGVVAHELSHILNGDMKLNLRLIAVLSGITFISQMGEFCLHGNVYSRRSNNKAGLLGLGLLLIGAVGSFFAHLIKAAVNRQREYLADAAAVQFTRDPNGIADALKLIGAHSSSISSVGASQTSHMFISSYKQFSSLMATHPPLPKRIRAIEPKWDGRFAATVLANSKPTRVSQPAKPQTDKQKMVAAAPVMAAVIESLAAPLTQMAHEPADAASLALLVIQPDAKMPGSAEPLCLRQRLTLVQLLLPTLSQLSPSQVERLQQQLQQQWQQQSQQLSDWAILQLLCYYLNDESSTSTSKSKPKSTSSKQASAELLSLMAIHASDDEQEQRRAFYCGANSLGMYQLTFQPQVSWQDAAADFARLSHTGPNRKKRVLLAFQRCANQDQHVNDDEMALLQCLALLLDAPATAPFEPSDE